MQFAGIERASSREAILQVLLSEFPLSLLQIQQRLRTQHRMSLSLQAVHKALRSLRSCNAVAHTKNGYQIVYDWALEAKEDADGLMTALEEHAGAHELSEAIHEERRIIAHFPTLIAGGSYWHSKIRQVARVQAHSMKKDILRTGYFPYGLLVNTAASLSLSRDLLQLGYTARHIYFDKSALGKWALRFYRGIGVHAHLSRRTNTLSEDYFTVIDDCVIRASLSAKAKRDIVRITREHKSIMHIPSKLLELVFNHGGGMSVSVEKNPAFAQSLRDLAGTLI